jgi:hypothetical protein
MRGRLRGASFLVVLALAPLARADAPGADAPSAAAETPVAPSAAAEPPELALTWQVPPGCVSVADVEGQFVRLLGGAARAPSGKHIAASAIVRTSAPSRWVLDLATVMDGAAGRRTLAGDSCASVASAASLILALMIDPDAAARAEDADAVIAPPPPSATRAAPPLVIARAATPRAPVVGPYLRAFGGAVVSLLPAAAPAAGLAVGARRARLGAELSFVATNERPASVPDRGDVGGTFRFVAAGARACGLLGARIVSWQACLGGELEWLTGSGAGSGLALTQSKTARMLAGTGGLLVVLPLGWRLGLALDLAAAVRPYHPQFSVAAAGRIFQIPVTSELATLGLVITI